MEKLLVTVTLADLERVTPKDKPIIDIGAFIKLYNQKNCGQVHEINKIVELEKMHTSIVKNPHNLGAY